MKKHFSLNTIYGVIFVAIIAGIAYFIAKVPTIAKLGISPLIIGILLGMILIHTPASRIISQWKKGIIFSAKRILRLAIIFYGFNLTFQLIASVGLAGFLVSIIMLVSTLLLGITIGTKVFRLDRDSSILVAAGSAICGAAAVLAAEGTLKSESYKAAMAVGTVVLFGTISMFLYPVLMKAGLLGNLNQIQYGIFAGGSIHEVAQVVAAGSAVGHHAEEIAVTVKMLRVMMLAPMLIVIGIWLSKTVVDVAHKTHSQTSTNSIMKIIPWFAIGFVMVAGFNSLNLLPHAAVHSIVQIDQFLLAMAMTALGLETHVSKFIKAGVKPLLLALILFAWLFFGGLAITYLITSII
ncbi:YeiH family putative sulfate export transporter [Allofrancisella guangzhouensis]|uniref:Membrane protein n=1 Tax=Allofrancisella guangzhouensis TaxID=594679 RepID=A0A0A8E3H6_9GAMM|nr:YeiH family protein [Allofrancisella guangzhouensis]AJC48780.1 membrane protein [Allofrancisella guangzhouensis]MBK2028000.1 YeiH family putative sulfate export transporter [Allofrancisella guangzhouensis]MBK2044418.1 YeiH family putative sulfate export transporter [Allofrancisella guangzhouensis]MBK2045276.1 YeiH family putative sulfate export transporter [Allofrancisella guangzhouensis]